MDSTSTYLSEDIVTEIVRAAAAELREFLTFLNNPNSDSPFSSLADKDQILETMDDSLKGIASDFNDNPNMFSDEALVEMGEGFEKAIKHYARIEIRTTENVSGAAQVAMRGIYRDFRNISLEHLRSNEALKGIDIKLSGGATLEFNIANVNKALPIKYLEHHLDSVLDLMQYSAGDVIDAKRNRILVAADGDGTTYGSPTLDSLPTLEKSPACSSLIEFLKLGGIYVIISGNNLERTEARVKSGIPDELKNRFIVVANGAANMAVFNENKDLIEVEDYRLNALKVLNEVNKENSLDVIYLGDDGRRHGNDYDGFKAVGFERSILVGTKDITLVDNDLKPNFVPGLEETTGELLSAIVNLIQEKTDRPIFTSANVEDLVNLVRKS